MSQQSAHNTNRSAKLSAWLLVLCLLMFDSNVSAQTEPDRMAEDFVQVSLCVAEPTRWQDDILGVFGHAFLRLQSQYYGLDYCFSYEGERVNDNLLRYLKGETKMGMFATPTNEYLEDYKHWNRTVKEYALALPPKAEERLWEIMDKHSVDPNFYSLDLDKYGCAITIIRYVKQALGREKINYKKDNELAKMSRREIAYQSLEQHPWIRLALMIFIDSKYDSACPYDEKMFVPADLAKVWQEATIGSKQMATYKQNLVDGAPHNTSKPWFTPMLVALVVLFISLIMAFSKWQYFDWLMLTIQALVGCMLIFLWAEMQHWGNSGYILMVLFTPLTAIFWKWRKVWSMQYATLLTIGVVVLLCLPHMRIDPAVIVLACSYIIMYSKDGIKKLIDNIKSKAIVTK